jgi:hypothetical protein
MDLLVRMENFFVDLLLGKGHRERVELLQRYDYLRRNGFPTGYLEEQIRKTYDTKTHRK